MLVRERSGLASLSQEPTYTKRILVLDAETKKPIPDVHINFFFQKYLGAGRTNEKGEMEIRLPPDRSGHRRRACRSRRPFSHPSPLIELLSRFGLLQSHPDRHPCAISPFVIP